LAKKNRPLQHNCPPGKLLSRSIVEWRTGLKLLAQATRISTPHPDNCRVLQLSDFVKQEILARLHRVLLFFILRAGLRLRSQFLNGNYSEACPPFSLQVNCYLTGGRVVLATIEKAFIFELHSPQLLIPENFLNTIGNK